MTTSFSKRKSKKRCFRILVVLIVIISLFLSIYLPIYFLINSEEELKKTVQGLEESVPEEFPQSNLLSEVQKISQAKKICESKIISEAEIITEAMVPGWEANVSRDTHHYIYPDNVTTVIQIKNTFLDLFLLVVVCSAPSNFDQRNAIRETWATLADNATRVVFLLGETDNSTLQTGIIGESDIFDDIIQEGFVDSYNNLTIKSVMMLKWSLQHPAAKFLMKVDDDTYLNLPALVKLLRAVTRRKNLLVGRLICKSMPSRIPGSKWFTPHYIFDKQYFPNYLSGSGYFMSRDVIPKLYKAALSTPIVHLEDVYITGVCAYEAGVKPLLHYGFYFERRNLTDACDPRAFTFHRMRPSDFYTAFVYVNDCSFFTQNPRVKNISFIPNCKYS